MTNEQSKHTPRVHHRHLGREMAMQMLFQHDLSDCTIDEDAFEKLRSQVEAIEEMPDKKTCRRARKYAEELVRGVVENLASIDKEISDHASGWDFNRMALVDVNIMRVSIYEMQHVAKVPPVVSIDEAASIARDFCSPDSIAFICGLLNAVKDTLDRPAREAVEKL
jgi:transcription antitermination protein NusB